ncbi:isopeptide-forming domain-containing fimbrial protein [Olsenella urininfantis]|uniref:isopeptide-forming domain-containing fimbrial protein n=1 Tax=Olsenella urininfantis TaxID=1871033 RepID=UPI0009873313|nr:isopeptide-forming domain-containing fimbrial protein [Olsenella urininfantis]
MRRWMARAGLLSLLALMITASLQARPALAADAAPYWDESARTSALVLQCVPATGNTPSMPSTEGLNGVVVSLTDAHGNTTTKTSATLDYFEGRLVFEGLAWGSTYTMKVEQVPNGYMAVHHLYKTGDSYEVSVTDEGWVLVDGLQGNAGTPDASLPGVNYLMGKTPFKLYFGEKPEVKKTVDGGPEVTAEAGDALSFKLASVLPPAAAYNCEYDPTNLHLSIAYEKVELSDLLDARLKVQSATLLLDGSTVTSWEAGSGAQTPGDLAAITVSAEEGGTRVLASLTPKGIRSLATNELFGEGKSHDLKLVINAVMSKGVQSDIPNVGVLVVNSHESRSKVVVHPKPTSALKVTKTIVATDPTAIANQKFDFVVTLDDKDVSGSYGDMAFENGVARLSLASGQSAEAKGLPVGINYKVEELRANQDGFVTSSEGAEGRLVAGETAVAAFTNTLTPPPTPPTPTTPKPGAPKSALPRTGDLGPVTGTLFLGAGAGSLGLGLRLRGRRSRG